MGIERFFRSIEENKITNLKDPFTTRLEKSLSAKYLFIDFNSIIYITSFQVVHDFNYLIYKTILNETEDKRYLDILEEYFIELEPGIKVSELKELLDEVVDCTILEKIEDYLINMLQNYIKPELLEHLFIAVDGVPTKSKIVEQKGRRYMGGIIHLIEKEIYEKYGMFDKAYKLH